jgi:hypothetical protein
MGAPVLSDLVPLVAPLTTGLIALLAGAWTIARLIRGDDKKGEEIRRRLEAVQPDLEDRQYALTKEYHSRGLAQSTQSFWFSLLAATLGFIVIILAIVLAIFRPQDIGVAIVQLASGTVIEAVSALFFVQSNKARELLVKFFDKLREDRKLEEAMVFARDMPDGELKQRLHVALAASFSGSIPEELVKTLLGGQVASPALGSTRTSAPPPAASASSQRLAAAPAPPTNGGRAEP